MQTLLAKVRRGCPFCVGRKKWPSSLYGRFVRAIEKKCVPSAGRMVGSIRVKNLVPESSLSRAQVSRRPGDCRRLSCVDFVHFFRHAPQSLLGADSIIVEVVLKLDSEYAHDPGSKRLCRESRQLHE